MSAVSIGDAHTFFAWLEPRERHVQSTCVAPVDGAEVRSVPSDVVSITRWTTARDTAGERHALTWRYLVAFLSRRTPRPPGYLAACARGAPKDAADLPAWSPAVFSAARAKANVVHVTALVLDVDTGSHSLDAIGSAYAGRRAVLHSTRSYRPDAPTWRIAIAISRPMTREEHGVVWRAERERLARLGIAIDPSACDASRIYFSPVLSADGAYVAEALEGELLDVDDRLEREAITGQIPLAPPSGVREGAPAKEGSPTAATTTDEPPELARISTATRVRRAAAWVTSADVAVSGDRGHDVAMRVSTAVVQGFALGNSADAREVYGVWAQRCNPPWSASEIAHKLAEASRVGRMTWGEKLLMRDEASEAASPSSEAQTWKTPAERARTLGAHLVRLKTGIAALDYATRGGIPVGRLAVASGPPGGGKTTALANVTMQAMLDGAAVAILAADEDADGILIRIGQMMGLDRAKLERNDTEECETLASVLEPFPFELVDAEEVDGVTIDDVSRALAKKRQPGQPSVLMVDSIQTARTEIEPEESGVRMRIDAIVVSLKRAAKVDGHLVFATSEVTRGAYRSPKDRTNPLASSKESSAIEYAAALLMVFSAVPGEPDLVEVVVPKNRLGEKPTFRLRLDRSRAIYAEETSLEVEQRKAVEEASAKAAKANREHAIRRDVIDVCAVQDLVNAPLTSSNKIINALKVAGKGARKEDVGPVINAMLKEGLRHAVDDPKRGLVWDPEWQG